MLLIDISLALTEDCRLCSLCQERKEKVVDHDHAVKHYMDDDSACRIRRQAARLGVITFYIAHGWMVAVNGHSTLYQ